MFAIIQNWTDSKMYLIPENHNHTMTAQFAQKVKFSGCLKNAYKCTDFAKTLQ